MEQELEKKLNESCVKNQVVERKLRLAGQDACINFHC